MLRFYSVPRLTLLKILKQTIAKTLTSKKQLKGLSKQLRAKTTRHLKRTISKTIKVSLTELN